MNALRPDWEALRETDALRRSQRREREGAPDAPELGSDARAAVVGAVRSLPSIDDLTELIRARLIASWPAFGETIELEGELRRTIETNLRQFFERVVVSNSEEILQAPPEALHFAIAVQHQGIDTSALLQAYRVGQNLAWSWWMEHLAREIVDHGVLLEAIEHSSRRMFTYVDAVVEEQVHLWEGERARWAGRLAVQRAGAVRAVLTSNAPVAEESARAIGFPLERELVAGVLWEQRVPDAQGALTPDGRTSLTAPQVQQEGEGASSGLELAAEAMAREIGVERTLIVPADTTCIWVWFATDDELDVDALQRCAVCHLRAGQGLALSLPDSGLEGFRRGHRQALRAQRFAEFSRGDTGVVRFDEVETLCVMSEDPELLAEFVTRKLGGLAADERNAEQLRQTVLVWLREGGNASRAADRLCTHKNTVRNRLRRAEQLVGRPLGEDRLGLELALTMVQQGAAGRG